MTMTLLQFVVTFAVLLLTIQASNLRNGSPIQEVINDLGRTSDDVTQDSSALDSVSDKSKIIEIQSKMDTSKVGETSDVKAWAQCGGLYYVGDTTCQPLTLCKQLSEFISLCFPESKPTEKVIRLAF